MEAFVEILVKKKTTLLDRIKVITPTIAIILFNIYSMRPGSILFAFLPMIIIASCFVVYCLVIYNSIEYEYILVNNELDIDKIMGKSKRKKVITIKKNQIDDFDSVKESKYTSYRKKSNKIISVASDENSDENYYIALNDNRKTLIILDRVDDIYKILKKR